MSILNHIHQMRGFAFHFQIKLILDNLLNCKQEPEDEIVAAASALWQRMIGEVKTEGTTSDWVAELYDL